MKVICFGVRNTEKKYFIELNNNFNYDLVLVPELLTHDNVDIIKGCDAVILRANCVADKQNLDIIKSFGVEYLLTRTVGYNHIDLEYAHKLGFKMARVPSYSPNSVSELAVSLSLGLLRNTFYMADKMSRNDFTVDDNMFAKEIRNSTIGVVGTGRIGLEAAKSFKGMGAEVLGFDIYKNENAKDILKYVELDELFKKSDLITLHMPYIKGSNDNFINEESISKMKDGVVIVNTARGELVDNEALLNGLLSNKIKSVALDTVKDEQKIYFKKFDGSLPVEIYDKLKNLYPRVILTPHIGSFTDMAITNMVEISYQNLQDFVTTGDSKNKI